MNQGIARLLALLGLGQVEKKNEFLFTPYIVKCEECEFMAGYSFQQRREALDARDFHIFGSGHKTNIWARVANDKPPFRLVSITDYQKFGGTIHLEN